MSLDISLHYECDGNEITVFTANVTHNLGKMADKAGVYQVLWRPEEIGVVYAKDAVKLLEDGLRELKSKQKYFEKFNAPNGWGLYEHFVPFVQDVLDACYKYPNAKVHSSV